MKPPTAHTSSAKPQLLRLQALLQGSIVAHANFRGPPVDISELTPHELGQLWADLLAALALPAASHAFQVAQTILQQARELDVQPALDEAAALAVFSQLQHVANAVPHLRWLACQPFPALAQHMRRILGRLDNLYPSNFVLYCPYAVALWADEECQQAVQLGFHQRYAHAPYLLQEFASLPQWKIESLHAINLEHHFSAEYPPAVASLQLDPAYCAFAQQILSQAVAHLQAIVRGEFDCSSDGAFVAEDLPVLLRAVKVAAMRDEAWLAPILQQLFTLSVTSMPAQAQLPAATLAIKLAQVMAEVPTPEGVQAMLAAYAQLGAQAHASVKKKIERCLKPAQRGLGARPEIALRLIKLEIGLSAKEKKQQQAMLCLCLEGTYSREFSFSLADWQHKLLASELGASVAQKLIWRSGAHSFMLACDGQSLLDSQQHIITLASDSRISLWHPLHSDLVERTAWQAQIRARKLGQPFRQAFREFYRLPATQPTAQPTAQPAAQLQANESECELFIGHVLNISNLIGLARKEGWKLERAYGFSRQFGAITACFDVGTELYPGMQGTCYSGALYFTTYRAGQTRRVPLASLPPLLLSEACRAVDLLISVAGFALEDEELAMLPLPVGKVSETSHGLPQHPSIARMLRVEAMGNLNLNQMAQMRRLVLEQTFAEAIMEQRLQIAERHARVGEFSVHLNTGRVSRHGAHVELELPRSGGKLKAVPWLPYDEVLLERIVRSLGVLLAW